MRSSHGTQRARVSRRWGIGLGSSFAAGIRILGWTLLLIVPGIIAAVRYSLVLVIAAVEGDSSSDILQRSRTLVAGKGWTIFGILAISNTVLLLFSTFVNLPLTLLDNWWMGTIFDYITDIPIILNSVIMLSIYLILTRSAQQPLLNGTLPPPYAEPTP